MGNDVARRAAILNHELWSAALGAGALRSISHQVFRTPREHERGRGQNNPCDRLHACVSFSRTAASRPNLSLRSDSAIHRAISARAMAINTTPDGTHMITPPSCWSARGVSPHRAVEFT